MTAHGVVLSAFTGAGGLDLGLEAAGLTTLACIERDADCRRTLELNRAGWKLIDEGDAVTVSHKIAPRDLGLGRGDLDVLAGGPPCQPFSTAAQWTTSGRRGMEDDRAGTVRAFMNLVASFQPRVVLLENVPGFVQGDTSALPYIGEAFRELNARSATNYQMSVRTIDSTQYGVPQRRKRVIIVANRDGKAFDWPAPTHGARPMTAWDALAGLTERNLPAPAGYWAELLPSIPEGHNYQFLTAKGDGEEVFGYRTRYWSFLLKLAKHLPAWTVQAHPGPATGPFHWDNRPLTVRERLRLQTFPDDWVLSGAPAAQIRQAGNATPPLLAEVVGRAIVQQYLNPLIELPAGPRFLLRRRGRPPAAAPAAKVPSKYRHLIGSKPGHPGAGRGPGARLDT